MSPRSSSVRMDRIDYGFWLVFGSDGSMRFTRTEPSIERKERKMSCSVTLPTSLFKTPELKATLVISDPGQPAFNIDIDAASQALKGALGVDIDFRVETPE